MKFHYGYLDDCHTATGTVIVIDVLRAFSMAAYAFSLDTREILLVGTVEEALSLRLQIPIRPAHHTRRRQADHALCETLKTFTRSNLTPDT